jgi:TetR/AcrR family transcriptional regulator, repressor for neighboring sulfatase
MPPPPPTRPRPHGRTEVVDALVDAATRLYAEHGPAAASLRDVAREANVNLGLIHRYIGGKQDLLAEVLARRPGMPPLPPAVAGSPEELVELILQIIATDAAYTRVMMRAALDGFDVQQAHGAFPLIDRASESTRAALPRVDADARVALLSAATLGWQVVGALMLNILDQTELTEQELARTLRPALLAFLTADAGPGAAPSP